MIGMLLGALIGGTTAMGMAWRMFPDVKPIELVTGIFALVTPVLRVVAGLIGGAIGALLGSMIGASAGSFFEVKRATRDETKPPPTDVW
jgi:hypothetical protein